MAILIHRFFKPLCALLLAVSLLQTGCTLLLVGAAAAGTGVGVAYHDGALRAVVKADPPKVAEAAKESLSDMKITVTIDNSDQVSGLVKGVTADDKTVTVRVKREADGVSNIEIRVGFFGNEAISREILQHINEHLGLD